MTADGYFIGLMSGTSLDGIDAALIHIENGHPTLVAAREHPWPEELRQRLLDLGPEAAIPLLELGQLDVLCGEAFALAVVGLLEESDHAPEEITAIGSHGQTIFHHPHPPAPFSTQIGDPNVIAQRTGITTVADFRRRDLAAGGQGAPLVPLFHQQMFQDPERNRVILNIGGIANLTRLPANEPAWAGFDSGPGNCLMDQWIRHHLGPPFDRNGQWAGSGKVLPELLDRLLEDPYFGQPPPKSTGTEHFSLEYLQRHLEALGQAAPEDVQATLLALTARTIAFHVTRWAPGTQEVLVCGGGCHNALLMAQLAAGLAPARVTTTAEAGVDPDWVEAMAFAWLAARTLSGQPGNLPSATGASRPVVLGGIYTA